ncbi:intradiol ring-cleavage dioxygenase [Streptomyces sp. NPDC051940]|uniref:intradiol ring-cleavage dioxygenase n=1 Tax=Streptomyces sp. NPDC051940 TaxID=3155675 RepID=UPI00341F4343
MAAKHAQSKMSRRRAIALGGGAAAGVGAAAAVGYAAFGEESAGTAATAEGTATATGTSVSGGQCVLMSSVTEGPYYLDGALVRKDITEGKEGVPLDLEITVQDTTDSCAPVKGAAVEIWHCDAWGYYSGYTTANPGGSAPAESEDGSDANDKTYLRGYQIAGGNGVVKFRTIFPGWYTPRTCHIHIRVHTGGEKADGTYEGGKTNYTGQLFFPDDTAEGVFAVEPYAQHTGTYTRLADDMVYDGKGTASGLLALEGSAAKGYRGTITLGIDPDAESTGAGSGGGGTPPSGEPPTGSAPPSPPAS